MTTSLTDELTLTFDDKAGKIRAEKQEAHDSIERHGQANQSYMESGIRLLELAGKAHELFAKQVPEEKRRLLDFLISNCTWKEGALTPTFRQPFDLLVDTNTAYTRDKTRIGAKRAKTRNWPARPDSNR